MKKAIINFFRAIFRRNIVVANDQEFPFKIIVVDVESDSLSGALGLSDEKAKSLGELCEKSFIVHKDLVASMKEVGAHCNHINEFYFCSHILAHLQHQLSNPLRAILGVIGRPKGD